MKKIILSLMVIALSLSSIAQEAVGTPEQLAQFSKTTTYVVLEKNPLLQYNHIIQETVKKHWTITPFEFVTFSTDEFEEARKDENKSFLIIHQGFYEKDKTKAKYQFLDVILGGNYEYERDMPVLATVPISYVDVEEESYAYKLGALCHFLQNHIELTKAHPELTSKKKVVKHYYKNITGNIQDKTLYVTKDVLAKNFKSMKEIKALYPYKVELVEQDAVLKAIDEKNKDVVFVHKVGPEGGRKARCFNTIVGAADAQLYYFNHHMISDKMPEGLSKKDWKKLGKAKKK